MRFAFYSVIILNLLFAFNSRAESHLWFVDETQKSAQQELRDQLMIFHIAQVEPALSHVYLELNQANKQYQQSKLLSRAYLLMDAFWFQLSQKPAAELTFEQPFSLHIRAHVQSELEQLNDSTQLFDLVMQLQPKLKNYELLRQRILYLNYLQTRFPKSTMASHIQQLPLLVPGDSSTEISHIRKRLWRLGDYRDLFSDSRHLVTYDEGLVIGIKAFQARHGLLVDGIIGPKTRHWLYLPFIERSRLIARSLIRQVHDVGYFTEHYIQVNIPAFEIRLLNHGVEEFVAKVIVGLESRPTPIMHSTLTSVVLNPYWNVPKSILRKDIIPKINHDPSYVSRHRYEVVDQQANVLDLNDQQVQQLEWHKFPYRLRQLPGANNSLGRYRFHLDNNQAIYLHDTPSQHLFQHPVRAFSSGCVRVEGAAELAQLLMSEQSFLSQVEIQRKFDSLTTNWIRLAQPLPVYLVYWLVWVDDGQIQFRDDIYQLEENTALNDG